MRTRKAALESRLPSYADPGFSRFVRRAFLAGAGYDPEDLARPVVGIADTSSDLNPCHRDMPALREAVRRGVLEAGGLPLAFPTISLHEILMSPTTMLWRNLLAMETEEMLRGLPLDAVVLLGGCDKTVPAQLMAAASADLPAVAVVAGPMRTGRWRGERLGACTDCRRLWARHRAGELDEADLAGAEQELCATGGTCMVMGTASTMACLAEVLGLALPGSATPPSGSGARLRAAVAAGRVAARLAAAPVRPREILTPAAFGNAAVVLAALGGSTNAVVHLLALARRAGVTLTLDDLAAASSRTPLLLDLKPAGSGYMEDFHAAGGMPALLRELAPLLDLSAGVVEGGTLGDRLAAARPRVGEVIRSLERPLGPPGGLVVLRGSLAPDGAVLKRAAASPALMRHEGPAVVFESPDDAVARLDDPSLGITPDHVLVLRNAGPRAAGMPEAGSLPIPKYLAAAGVKDMVRVSDGRMSGTSYGAVVLHVAPEAAAGGPLALVRDGDRIRLDADAGRLELVVPEDELARRRTAWTPPALPPRGWARVYAERVLQADRGCDLDFL
ncbi:MAG: dihydroxy-acid dehydratase [Deltaproteobacteria bacterium]|nr:dihydroxy-acid dehydratase [Deltaproteobacteria bacterium]